MTYTDANKRATIKYTKTRLKELTIRYKTEEFNAKIKPAIEKSGLPTATFIKQAINEKIKNDGLDS